MADDEVVLLTTKLLTFVFEDDAPLPKNERLDLIDGIYLASLPGFLLQKDRDSQLLSIDPHFSRFFKDHLHDTTLNVEYAGDERLNYEGVKSEEAIAKRKIDNYLLAAMIHSPRFLAPYARFITIPAKEKVCNSSRMKEFGRLYLSDDAPLTESDFSHTNELYGTVRDLLSTGATGRLPTGLRYYQQAFRTDIDLSVRFLGIMMAMEAFFSRGTSEVSHQVSERTAFFLKQEPEEREELYDRMRSHYGLRSEIAHGGSPNIDPKALEQSFVHLLLILRDMLVSVLGSSTLLSLFKTSNSKQFSDAMRRLIFRGDVGLGN